MTGNEYQALAMRTNDGESTERLGYHTDPGLNEVKDFGGVLNGCLGLAGESLGKCWTWLKSGYSMRKIWTRIT